MSAHRRHLITRNSDGYFWCGIFGFKPNPEEAELYDSIRSAHRAARDLCEPPARIFVTDEVTVEPADWYLPDSILKPLECST